MRRFQGMTIRTCGVGCLVIGLTVLSASADGWARPEQGAAEQTPTATVKSTIRSFEAGGVAGVATFGTARRASVSMLATSPSVALDACEDDTAWLCGAIPVPIDRAHPNGRKLRIGFRVLPHSDPLATAKDALIAIDGGPGSASTAGSGFFGFLVEPLLTDRDFLLMDNRGTGSSGAIYCHRLQDVLLEGDEWVAAAGACGRKLGRDADRYGTGDVALDLEAIRKALGYPRLSFYAQSYGSVLGQAYAVRFPHRVRALFIDSGMPVSDPGHVWTWRQRDARGFARAAALTCLRAPTCAAAQPDAEQAVGQLMQLIRHHPVHGLARRLDGHLQRVKVDEVQAILLSAWDPFVAGELPAAADALAAGDKRPILRMAAETMSDFEPGEASQFSAGDGAAAFCNDSDFVWDRSDSRSVRRQKYAAAVAALPPHAFAPFSTRAWLEFFLPTFCLRWPVPDRFTPAVPTGATITGLPVLVVHGDQDVNVTTGTTRALRQVIPGAHFVSIAGAAHPASGYSECAREILHHFLATTHAGDRSCASDPANIWAAVPAFPLASAQAEPATPAAGDASTNADRRVVTSAVRTVLDAWIRSFRIPGSVGTGYGLRGGTFDFDRETFGDHARTRLHGDRFVGDVVVTGRSTLTYDTSGLHMRISVTGPTGEGTLTADGTFGFLDFADFSVTGQLDGRAISVTVPAN